MNFEPSFPARVRAKAVLMSCLDLQVHILNVSARVVSKETSVQLLVGGRRLLQHLYVERRAVYCAGSAELLEHDASG